MARCIAETEIDMVEQFNAAEWYVRVRCRHTWRVIVAVRVLSIAVFVARLLGVGIRIVPQGRLVVPHHKLTQLRTESREDNRRAEEAQIIRSE
jgi:hypothetical protein